MRSGFSARKHNYIILFIIAVLTSTHGFRLSSSLFRETDPLDDAILVGLDGNREALMMKRGDPAETAGMWFGPRLGRRDKRSVDEIDFSDASKEDEIVEILRETPWAIIPLRGGKRQTSFTPRLGRDSGEDDELDLEQRSPPFAPRLGRRLVPFRPRLGRDHLPQDIYSPRLGRSVPSSPQSQNQKQQTKH